MAEKNLSLPFLTAFNPKGVLEAQRQLASLGSSVKNFAKGVIGAFGGVSATTASVNFVRNAITQSRDLERQTAALGSIFGETAGRMMNFSKQGVQMGLSTAEAAKASTFLGSVLKSAGFEMDDVAANTEKLVGLASDLAATYGYDVSEALTGMTALFRGEYDPIEKFGVAMKQSEVNTILAARSQKNLTGQELLHAQQLVRLELLMQRTADAQGAFTRQGDSLFVQQSKLSALWKNMQATIGEQLTPALARFLQRLQPIVENFAPHLEKIFGNFAKLVETLIPQLGLFADKMGEVFDAISNTFGAANPLLSGFLTWVIQNIDGILLFIATLKILKGIISITVAAIETYTVAIKIATGATAGLTVAQMASPWGLAAIAIAAVTTAIVLYANQADKAATATERLNNKLIEAGRAAVAANPELQKTLQLSLARAGYGMTDETAKLLAKKGMNDAAATAALVGGGAGTGGAGAAVKTFFTDLAEEMKKQALRFKLTNLGASESLADAILGSTSWEATANKIISGGKVAVSKIQSQFNKTKAGLDEIAKAAEEAKKKLEEYNKAVQAAAEFASDMKDVLKELTSGGTTASLGVFEQQVVSTFESIVSKVKDAVSNNLIAKKDAESLISYANASSASMRTIAKQRDALAERIQVVRDLISATKQAVTGFVNINNLLESQTKTVTETMVTVSNGIRLTLTRSMDVSALGGSITDKFREILDKTKKFAQNLRELKRLGLDQNLFKQIVDAGLESGGATAAAIIEGGSGTVNELNSLFADLEMTGAEIAEQTAQVMYGAGVDVTNGLIEGLLSQESALAQAAKQLADSFTNAFNASLGTALNANLPASPIASVFSMANRPDPARSPQRYAAWVAGMGGVDPLSGISQQRSPQSYAKALSSYNLTVNAGIGTNGATVGQEIVNAIKQYERSSGNVWTPA